MTAYVLLQSKITDSAAMARYRDAVMPVIHRFGGRHIVRGERVIVLEGQHDGRGLSIFEFPSIEAVQRFWQSPDYSEVKALRKGAAEFEVWAVPGFVLPSKGSAVQR